MSNYKQILRAVRMTAQCSEVDYNWRAPKESAYTARMWCNAVGETISACGDDEWTAVQAVHAMAEMYTKNPQSYFHPLPVSAPQRLKG
jgi:hypothetical protein